MTENQGQYAPPPASPVQYPAQPPAAQAPAEQAPPQAEAPAPEPVPQQPESPAVPPAADEPATVPSVPEEAPAGDGTGSAPQPGGVVTAEATHPSVLVRLRDVIAHVENFLARHPELRALGESDLKSGLATIERHSAGTAPAQPAGNVS